MIKTNITLLNYIEKLYTTGKYGLGIRKEKFSRNEVLLYKDDSLKRIYVIIQGLTKCFITEENGKDYLLEFLGKGELVGEIEFLIKEDNLSSVETLSTVEAFSIDSVLFEKLIQTDREFVNIILKELATRIFRTAKRASFQQIYPLKYSIIKIILALNLTDERISKQDLASYLGISIRVLNRILKELINDNLITFEKGVIKVKSQNTLENYILSLH
ncbi:Crp/Fnr family transcriptional regulator [Tenacibaculum litopenaei]|uniref:Crp/Fnr family transcriptional regulator n=1 Tax=Tenacibaculum litopenaei TaxID=396016 RepID=UPI003895DB3D